MNLPPRFAYLASEPGPATQNSGLNALAVMPVLDQGRFVAAVALYF